jgi:two-component system, OmpR family, sensor histidine kinase BaeS
VTARRMPGLAGRLFLAQALVVAVGAVTVSVVSAAVGPPSFTAHLAEATGGEVSASTSAHAEEAFRAASTVSVTVAVLAALAAALLLSAYASRRIARPVRSLAAAAEAVAAGRYAVRVPATGLGVEFDAVTAAFNTMADRLEGVEATRRRLLADMAHEMRTPLATLEAYAEALADGVVAPGEPASAVLHAQTARLRRLADDVAAVSRAEEHQLDLRPRRVDPAALVEAAADAAREAYARRGVRLETTVHPGLGPVHVDPDRLGQVLANLLDNALRHTPAGGLVRLRAEAGRGGVVLNVVDTGEGILPEHLPHVFERFYRADASRDRRRGGSGIGLAIARALVEAQGGRIEAASPGLGQGASFTVTLPVSRT